MRRRSPEPFLRGNAWPGTDDLPYPRADPADLDRLPGDTVGTARLPVGVRLEFVGTAEALELDYQTQTDDLGYRGEGAGTTFTLVTGDETLSVPAHLGSGIGAVRAPGSRGGDPDQPIVVYLPEGMRPRVLAVAVRRRRSSCRRRAGPRWLAYGDSIAEGWIASGPSGAWPAVAARRHGLDVVNLGYAGSARWRAAVGPADRRARRRRHLDLARHQLLEPHPVLDRAVPRADARVHRARARGHPDTPIVVTSPILRPDAETTANALGATLVDLRVAMEDLTRELIAAGDAHLTLVEGGDLIGADDLPDGIHPGDHGHAVLADAFGGAVAAACAYTGPSLEG